MIDVNNGSNGHGNGHGDERFLLGANPMLGVDKGLREGADDPKPCLERLPHGGWCTLPDKHCEIISPDGRTRPTPHEGPTPQLGPHRSIWHQHRGQKVMCGKVTGPASLCRFERGHGGKCEGPCGEVVQIVGKLMRRNGRSDHWDGAGQLHERLADEMGDALAAILFVCEQSVMIKADRVFGRAMVKLHQFRAWHKEEGGYMRQPLDLDGLVATLRAARLNERCNAWSYPGHTSWEPKLNKLDGRQCALDVGHAGDHELSGPWTAVRAVRPG